MKDIWYIVSEGNVRYFCLYAIGLTKPRHYREFVVQREAPYSRLRNSLGFARSFGTRPSTTGACNGQYFGQKHTVNSYVHCGEFALQRCGWIQYYLQVKDTIPLLHLRLLHQMFKALNLRASSGSGRRSDRNSSGSSNRTPSLANTTVSMHRFITPSLASSGTTIGRSTSTYSSTNASSLASSRWNIQAISYGNQNRIRCTNSTALDVLSTVCFDPSQPNVYFGSARYADTIRPCKIVRVVSPVDHLECYVVAGHTAILHNEYFDLLSYDASVYELVEAQSGVVPPGKRPVNGGYDQQGRALYHGIALHSESGRKYRVPGEVSEHTVSICFRWTFFLRWRRT